MPPASEELTAVLPAERAANGTALYVHLPFCAAKCSYCDFFSVPAEGQDLEGTLQAVLLEAEQRAPRSPNTVFVGGGTPSLYAAGDLRRFFDRLDDLTGFRASAVEITAECNPESLDPRTAEAFLASGVDRLSIGVQSLRPAILEEFGRVHSVEQSFQAFRNARGAGFERVSLDLIYAAPGLSTEMWREDLARLLELSPDHLSAYNLTFEPETQLERKRQKGEVAPLDEDTELDQFWATRELCEAAGLEAYEISNFARGSEQRCEHNLAYWRNAEYVGIGPSAVSKVGPVRFGNPRGINSWRRPVEAGEAAAAWSEEPDALARLGETWWLGLRTTEGVDPQRALETAGFEGPGDPACELAEVLAEQGLLETQGGRWRLTQRGLPLADGVARKFLELGS